MQLHPLTFTIEQCEEAEATYFKEFNFLRNNVSTIEKLRAAIARGVEYATNMLEKLQSLNVHVLGIGDETGEATHMLIWDYDLKKLKFYKAKEKVRDVAKGLKMEATLKSSRREKKIEGKKVKVGYSIYQSMRLAINTSLEDADKLTDDVKEEIQKMENMLKTLNFSQEILIRLVNHLNLILK